MAKAPPMKYRPVEPKKPSPRSMPVSTGKPGTLKANVKPVSGGGASLAKSQMKPIK